MHFLLGPLALVSRKECFFALIWTLALTVFTQVGGVFLWPFWSKVYSLSAKDRWIVRTAKRFWSLFFIYFALSMIVLPFVAEKTGRKRLPLYANKDLPLGPQSFLFPMLNRTYVQKHAYDTFIRSVKRAAQQEPDMVVRYLDAGFPFPYLPLLPHLSHVDGQKIDVAFQFKQGEDYVDKTRSPIGYWGYAKETKSRCTNENTWLRWDFDWMQPHLPNLSLDVRKNRILFKALAKERQVCGILLEPTLHKLLHAPKLQSNSCSVARHDDHFHVTIKKLCR